MTSTDDVEASRKALRNLLSSYYGIEETPSEWLEKSSVIDERRSSTDAETQHPTLQTQNTEAETLLRTLNLSHLMKKTFELKAETEELNVKLEHLLYNSYQKLEETASTISQMTEEAPYLEHTLEDALEKIVSVEDGNQQVNKSLSKGRTEVQILESWSKLLKTLRVAEELKENMLTMHQKGNTNQVALLFHSVTSILARISSKSTYVTALLRDLQVCSYEIRHDLLQKLEAEEHSEQDDGMSFRNTLDSLIMFDESQSVIRDILLRHARKKLSSSLSSCLGSEEQLEVWKYFTCCVLWLKNSFMPISVDLFKIASSCAEDETISKLSDIVNDQLILFRDEYLQDITNEDVILLEEEEEEETTKFFKIMEDIRVALNDSNLPVKESLYQTLEALLFKWKHFVTAASYNSLVRLLNRSLALERKIVNWQISRSSLEKELKEIFERSSFLLGHLEQWRESLQLSLITLSQITKNCFLQAVLYCSRYECKHPSQMLSLSYFLHCLNPSLFDDGDEIIACGDNLLEEYVLWRSFLLQVEFCSCSACYLDEDNGHSSSVHVAKVVQQITDISQEIHEVLMEDGSKWNRPRRISESSAYPNRTLSWEHFDTLFVSNRPVEFETPLFEDQVLIVCIVQRATRFWQEFLRLRRLSSNALEQLKSNVSSYIDTFLSLGIRFRKELLNKLYVSFQAVLSTGNEASVA
ncbi:hypothetical protein Gasu2_54750 [Galdieria sulphuraria]|uniref:Vacuolar protein sorting-associated protein 51 homolog n=1 Tax=Galdieria sulphuraria TaxID=130081 RepID=M2XBK7_GALSU|nr:uncharacterized protein Gasu_51350 [Galdieria sulphuraria]EME27277.1 hypothetical protein Gasu_51350 [Galdieria sulphuraria]GJD11335.1 hypothetical protein Gasu2_54750 [Galdieria sulphuraria]|eukprot:XP_005703797.1 hypothetical protein Gasu_51350 [Galdieria sulphuraria]